MSQVYTSRSGLEVEGWTCDTCLRYNPSIENRRCDTCNTWRDLDWECVTCYYKNFAKRSTCKECGGSKPQGYDQTPITYPGTTPAPDYSYQPDGYVPPSATNPTTNNNNNNNNNNTSTEHPWLCGLCQIENTPMRIVCFECSGHRERVEVRNRKYDNNPPSRNTSGILGSNNTSTRPPLIQGSYYNNNNNNFSGGYMPPMQHKEPPVRFEDLSADWLCGDCDNRNFAKRQKCNRCNKPKQEVEVKGAKFDDLKPKLAIPRNDAPLFPSRKRSPPPLPPPAPMDFRRPEDRSKDWSCTNCKNRNFAKRQKCNKCNKPREEVEDDTVKYEDEVLPEPSRGRMGGERRNILGNPPGFRGSSYPSHNYPQPRRVSGHTLSFRRDPPRPPAPKKRKWVDEDKSNDWYCRFCDINNFVKRDKCFRCMKSKKECMKEGDEAKDEDTGSKNKEDNIVDA